MLVYRLLKRQTVLKKQAPLVPKHLNKACKKDGYKTDNRKLCLSEKPVSAHLLQLTESSQPLQNVSPDLLALCFSFYPEARSLPKGCCEAPVKCQDTHRDT